MKSSEIDLIDKVNRALPGFSFSETRVDDVLKSIKKLKTQDKRRDFFDHAISRMERSAVSGWAGIYATLAALKECRWYWEGRFDSFEDFLVSECRIPFDEFCRLEASYHFAQEVANKCKLLDELKKVAKAPAVKKQGRPTNGKGVPQNKAHLLSSPTPSDTHQDLDLAAKSEEFREGYGSRGSGNRVYRFARLKRDAPKIAKEVIDGKFNRKLANDSWIVDLAAAEKAAEKRYPDVYKKPTRPSRAKSPLQKAMDAASKLTTSEWNQLVEWMNKQ